MSEIELTFEDPPPSKHSGNPLTAWLNALRAHPGVWAKYHTPVDATQAAKIRTGNRNGISAGEFEAQNRACASDPRPNKMTLYARYVGAPAAPGTEGADE